MVRLWGWPPNPTITSNHLRGELIQDPGDNEDTRYIVQPRGRTGLADMNEWTE